MARSILLLEIPCRTTSMSNCQFAIFGSRSKRCYAALTLAKLHALVSGLVLIRKSLTLPMVQLYIPVKPSSSAVPAFRSLARKSPIFIRPFLRKLHRRPVCVTLFSSTSFSNFAGEGVFLRLRSCWPVPTRLMHKLVIT